MHVRLPPRLWRVLSQSGKDVRRANGGGDAFGARELQGRRRRGGCRCFVVACVMAERADVEVGGKRMCE